MYHCKRCGYETEIKGNLILHFKRKVLCPADMNDITYEELMKDFDNKSKIYECEYCNKKFCHLSGKSRHIKICKKIVDNINIQNLENTVKNLENKIVEMSKIISVPNNTTNNIQNNNNSNNVNNINVRIENPYGVRAFGQENKEHLEDTIGDLFFMNLNFIKMIESLHFDPEYPENHNIRIKSSKRNLLEIFRGNKWDIVTFVNGLKEMVLNSNEIFKEYYINNKDKIHDGMTKDEVTNVLNTLYDTDNQLSELVKSLKNDMIAILENNRESIVQMQTLI